MAAAKHNIIVGRGEDYSATLTISDSNGDAVDLTDDTFLAHVRRGGGKPLVAEFTCAISDAENGVMTLTLDQAETLKLDGNVSYDWDLFRITDGTGPTTQLVYGEVQPVNNITDPT